MAKEFWTKSGKVVLLDECDWDLVIQSDWGYDNSRTKTVKPCFYVFSRNAMLINHYAGPGKKRIYMHRIILSRMLGRKLTDKEFADHIDGNGLNNTRENLRLCKHQENTHNHRLRETNKSGVTGVHWCKNNKRWHVQIGLDYGVQFVGYFDTIEDAALARVQAARKAFGEFFDPAKTMRLDIYERIKHNIPPVCQI